MRTATVRTNLTCNAHCSFCFARDSKDDPALFSVEAVKARIQSAIDEGAQEIVLSGGEPLLRPDLEQLVEHSQALGADVAIETNGTLLAHRDRVERLRAAGVSRVVVGLNATAALVDEIFELPGAWQWAERGVHAALDAGLRVDIAAVVTRRSADGLPRLAAWLGTDRMRGVRLLLHRLRDDSGADGISWADSLEAMTRAIDACRQVGVVVAVHPTGTVAQCLAPRPRQYPELLRSLAATGEGLEQVGACEKCAVADVCRGLNRAERADVATAANAPRQLPVLRRDRRFALGAGGDRGRAAAEQVTSGGLYVTEQQTVGRERVVRVNFHCNQDCNFCFVDRLLPGPTANTVEAEIRAAADDGVGLLSLSGGEPTLDPALCGYVSLVAELGMRPQLQTNATRIDAALAQRLAASGLEEAFVSLHAADADTSDAITRKPGTFEKTLHGVDALVEAGIKVRVNCVITGENATLLRQVVTLVADRWGSEAELVFSWASASTALVPVSSAVVPRASQVVDELLAATRLADARGVQWRGLEGECGVPLCALPAELRPLHRIPKRPTDDVEGFVRLPPCASCALANRCPGVRESYLELYGSDEIAAVSRP